MTIAPEVATRLAGPLDPKRVQKREGSGGRMLSYLEGHDVIRTANGIFGVGEWSYEVQELTHLGTELCQNRQGKQGNRVAYRAVVRASYNGHAFSDVGYGDATEYTGSALTPHELAAKEAVTDALKRCLKNYGDQFGLCLYDKDAPEHRGGTQVRSGERGGGHSPQPAAQTPPAVSSPDVQVQPGYMLAGDVAVHFGKNKDVQVRALSRQSLKWYAETWEPGGRDPRDAALKAAVLGFLGDPDSQVSVEEGIPF